MEAELCEAETPTTFPSARLYYTSTDGSPADEPVPARAWKSRVALLAEVQQLTSSPITRLASVGLALSKCNDDLMNFHYVL